MPANILNLSGLKVLAIKESDGEYHVKAEPAAISRLCPHCGELHRVQKHGSRSMFIRDLPTHVMTHSACEDRAEYEVRVRTRQGNVGTDLPTLLALLDDDAF